MCKMCASHKDILETASLLKIFVLKFHEAQFTSKRLETSVAKQFKINKTGILPYITF